MDAGAIVRNSFEINLKWNSFERRLLDHTIHGYEICALKTIENIMSHAVQTVYYLWILSSFRKIEAIDNSKRLHQMHLSVCLGDAIRFMLN